MDEEIYNELVKFINTNLLDNIWENDKTFENIPLNTCTSLHRQLVTRHIRTTLPLHRNIQQVQMYYNQYEKENKSILIIAKNANLPPCVMIRLILEYYFNLNKKQITYCMKNASNTTEYLKDKGNLYLEIQKCVEADLFCSPNADINRTKTGEKYELLLYEKLKQYSIPFESEDSLREKGFSKTPDAKLLIPIAIEDENGCRNIVTWIDSKAMFADRISHEIENGGQIASYTNRFGPGMIIYWFGFVKNISRKIDKVYVTNKFPNKIIFPGDIIYNLKDTEDILLNKP